MAKWNIEWSDDFLSGDESIDNAHKEIVKISNLLHEKIEHHNEDDEEEMAKIATQLADAVIAHMHLETDLMQKLGLEGWSDHNENHEMYKGHFDLEKKHALSPMMHVLMTSKMIKDYMQNHFTNYDLPDVQKIKAKLAENDQSVL